MTVVFKTVTKNVKYLFSAAVVTAKTHFAIIMQNVEKKMRHDFESIAKFTDDKMWEPTCS
jgi:hypothetical protein